MSFTRYVLVVVGLLSVPSFAIASGNSDAKIGLHLISHSAKGSPCTNPPLPACNAGDSLLTVVGELLVGYDAYVLVLDGASDVGVGGAAFGVSFGPGVAVNSWTRCADLEFPGGPQGISWPDSGSGNLLTWDGQGNCQNQVAVGDTSEGVTAVLGAFYLYAYAQDYFGLTPREYAPIPDFQVSDCQGNVTDLLFPLKAGYLGFDENEGFDPCRADTSGLKWTVHINWPSSSKPQNAASSTLQPTASVVFNAYHSSGNFPTPTIVVKVKEESSEKVNGKRPRWGIQAPLHFNEFGDFVTSGKPLAGGFTKSSLGSVIEIVDSSIPQGEKDPCVTSWKLPSDFSLASVLVSLPARDLGWGLIGTAEGLFLRETHGQLKRVNEYEPEELTIHPQGEGFASIVTDRFTRSERIVCFTASGDLVASSEWLPEIFKLEMLPSRGVYFCENNLVKYFLDGKTVTLPVGISAESQWFLSRNREFLLTLERSSNPLLTCFTYFDIRSPTAPVELWRKVLPGSVAQSADVSWGGDKVVVQYTEGYHGDITVSAYNQEGITLFEQTNPIDIGRGFTGVQWVSPNEFLEGLHIDRASQKTDLLRVYKVGG